MIKDPAHLYVGRRQLTINDLRELVVDNFAGGGGASTGIAQAIGRSVDIAINHDQAAIAMHRANHPDTKHYCESVWDVVPRKATQGQPVGLAWFSPDCTHFSKAKGSKPVSKKIRALAWVAVRWAATVKPRVIMLENVEEFTTWGPLIRDANGEMRPDPKRRGRNFRSFVNALKRHGYQVEWRELRACDYGAPTIRKRLFLIARRDGRPIVWPRPTHGDPRSAEVKAGRLKPWRTAAEIIDWSLPCPSIFDRKRPLAENTMRRIARGIQRFVIDDPNPFIIRLNYPRSGQRERMVNEPVQTATAKNDLALVNPFIVKINHHGADFRGQSLNEPMQTITAKNGWGIVNPFIVKCNHTTTKGVYDCFRGQPVEEPMQTITQSPGFALVAPTLIQMGYGERKGQEPRVLDLEKPLGTVTAGGNKFAIATAYLDRQFTRSVGHPADAPLGAVTAGGSGKTNLVAAFLAKHYGGGYTGPGSDIDEPVPTVTTRDHSALVTSHLVKLRGTCADGQPVTEPMPTITAGGLHVGEVRAFLLKYYGTAIGQRCDEPLSTVTTKHRLGLVTVHGQDYQIVDIGMRMLEPHELFPANGFPADYIIDRDADGKRYSKAAQVARCGNAVPPQFSEALVKANLPELCEQRHEEAEQYAGGL